MTDDDNARFALVIDQFEEIFTLCKDEQARHFFLEVLQTISHTPNRVLLILTMRADFYGRALLYKPLAETIEGYVSVRTETVAELRQAIIQPATDVGLTLEEGLTETLIDDSRQGAATLPLLQQALSELFARRAGHQLTKAAYTTIGGILGAIAHRTEEILQALGESPILSKRFSNSHFMLK